MYVLARRPKLYFSLCVCAAILWAASFAPLAFADEAELDALNAEVGHTASEVDALAVNEQNATGGGRYFSYPSGSGCCIRPFGQYR